VLRQIFEWTASDWLDELDWRSVLDVSESEEIRPLEQQIATLALQIARDTDRIKNIGERLVDTPSDYLGWALLEAEQNLKAQMVQKSEWENSLASAHYRKTRRASPARQGAIAGKIPEKRTFLFD
jgi:hypothetical protein